MFTILNDCDAEYKQTNLLPHFTVFIHQVIQMSKLLICEFADA